VIRPHVCHNNVLSTKVQCTWVTWANSCSVHHGAVDIMLFFSVTCVFFILLPPSIMNDDDCVAIVRVMDVRQLLVLLCASSRRI